MKKETNTTRLFHLIHAPLMKKLGTMPKLIIE